MGYDPRDELPPSFRDTSWKKRKPDGEEQEEYKKLNNDKGFDFLFFQYLTEYIIKGYLGRSLKLSTNEQKDVVSKMLKRNNVIVSFPPGGGKTLPIITFLFTEFLNRVYELKKSNRIDILHKLNNLNSTNFDQLYTEYVKFIFETFPKILVIVPRRQLAIQMVNDSFDVVYAFISDLLRLPYYYLGIDDNIDTDSILKYTIENIVRLFSGPSASISRRSIMNDFSIANIIVATTHHGVSCLEVLRHGDIDYVIYDEIQEYLPKPGMLEDEINKEDLAGFSKGIYLTKKKAFPFVLLTGSVNNKFLEEFVDELNRRYGVKIKSYLVKSSVGNRAHIYLKPITLISIKAYSEILRKHIKNNDDRILFILFSIGGDRGIFNLAKKLISELPVIQDLSSSEDLIETGNSQYDRLFGQGHSRFSDLDIILRFNERDIERASSYYNQGINLDDLILTREPDPSNILYQSLIRGFGFIVGSMPDRMKMILQNLFLGKVSGIKTNVIIATDAVGVGINVYAKKLYLPNPVKFTGVRLADVDDSTLVQIINRAGRMIGEIAEVFVDASYYRHVYELLTSVPGDIIAPPPISPAEIIDYWRHYNI